MKSTKKKSVPQVLTHSIFLIVCGSILYFLVIAPNETTPMLPHDENHEEFFKIASKKEAEKTCLDCHSENGIAPLSEQHPPKYRCLFCHKRQ